MFRGYDPAAVDAHIEMLTTKQQLLLDDVESLRARLSKSGDEAAALRKEVAVLTDTSPSPHAMQLRLAKMLRRAVDEVAEMQAEARAEAEALIASAEATQRKGEELLADLAAQQKVLEADHQETKEKLEAELASLRADAQQAREQLLADAKQRTDRDRQEARRAVDEASQQRIKILEQLMGLYRDLETVPAALESAYQEQKSPREASPEANGVMPVKQKVSTG